MLRFDSKNKNYNAASIYNDTQIAYFYASVNEPNGSLSISINADDKAALTANATIVKSDLEDFIDEVLELQAQQ